MERCRMAQIKIYGLTAHLDKYAAKISDAIHACVVEALHYPKDKRFHRFIDLAADRFIFPPDRGEQYTILEISIFEGRSIEAFSLFKKGIRPEWEDEKNRYGSDLTCR